MNYLGSLIRRYLGWWRLPDSNWGHKALQASALPTELKRRNAVILLISEDFYNLYVMAGKHIQVAIIALCS